MDIISSDNICNRGGDTSSSNPVYGDPDQSRRTSDHGSVFDSEDDLSLGADAQVLSTSDPSFFSPESSSISTGFHYESSVESLADRDPDCQRVIKSLAHVGRHASSDSILSNLSDFSRASHDVSSLLNAMTVDPEEFLTDLGFGEPDLRARIPGRFFDSPSKARGIDVDQFRQSLDQDDLNGSPSLDSPVWSDPGSCRIPFRFMAHTEPTVTVLSESFNSIPLISEPEEAPEDSFDLMRHLRLNKPCHSSKGMFLEPVTEELEVSSVGSGTVRTKLSRKLSNEGTIVREESLEQSIVESELLLSVPGKDNMDRGTESEELDEKEVAVHFANASQIVINVESNEGVCVSISEEAGTAGSVANAVIVDDYTTDRNTSIVDYNKNLISEDLSTKMDEEVVESFPQLRDPPNLRVASIVVQDSFELEEITNDDFNEKSSSCSVDPEPGLNVKPLRNCLTRENSGESSGFEEMAPDKESLTPNSSSPVLIANRLSDEAHVIVSDNRRPLAALLDPEMLDFSSEKTRRLNDNLDENSPRASFAQRRWKSLTKQRPVDGDGWTCSGNSFSPIDPPDNADLLGFKAGRDNLTADSGPRFLQRSTKEPSVVFSASNSDFWFDKTGVNYNSRPTFVAEKPLLNESDDSVHNLCVTSVGNVKSGLQVNSDIVTTHPKFRASSKSEVDLRSKESLSPFMTKKADTLEDNVVEVKEEIFKTMEKYSQVRDGQNNTKQETRLSRDLVARENEPLTLTGAAGACAAVKHGGDSEKALLKVDSEYQQNYLHEINVLEHSIQSITEEMDAIQELRLMISSELERMKHLLAERRDMLVAGVSNDSLGSGVSQKMTDLLKEQSSLNIGLSKISDELSIRRKASRRARIHLHVENAKRELKEERERCLREFREEIKEALIHDLSERFSSEIEFLRREVRTKDALIEQLKTNRKRETPRDKEFDCLEQRDRGQPGRAEDTETGNDGKDTPDWIEKSQVEERNSQAGNVKNSEADESDSQSGKGEIIGDSGELGLK